MENRYWLAYYQRLGDWPYIFALFVPAFMSSPFFTHLVTYSLIVFILIRSFNAWQGFNFVMASVGLLPLLIHLIFAISLLLYNCYRHIRLTINRFFCIVLSLTKQLYRDFELVQRITSNHLSCRIFLMVALITALVSNPQAIPYSSDAKTLHITHLHLINNQWRMLALLSLSISIMIKPIWEDRLQLLIKNKSIKIISLRESLFISSQIKQSPQEGLLIYHYSY